MTIKDLKYLEINSINPLYRIFSKVNRYFKENNGNKSLRPVYFKESNGNKNLMLVPTNET